MINDPVYAHGAEALREQVAAWMKRSNDPLLDGAVAPIEAQRLQQSRHAHNNG